MTTPLCLSLPSKIPPPPSPLHTKPPAATPRRTTTTTLLPLKHPQLEPLKHRLIQSVELGHIRDAFSVLDQMTQLGIPPDLVTYSVLLKSCIRHRDIGRGRAVHRCLVESGLELDSVVCNSLIALYSKCGDLEMASSIFEEMGEKRDLVSWSSMISCFAHIGMGSEAIGLFVEMVELGFVPNQFCFAGVLQACCSVEYAWVGVVVFGFLIKTGFLGSDVCVGCALIDMFAKIGDFVLARKVFDGMPERNVVVWTLMITRYAQHGLAQDGVKLFLDMGINGFEPDQFTMSSVVSACTELGSYRLGRQLHSQAIRMGLVLDTCVGCSLIDMYAKSVLEGSMSESRKVFDRMMEHNVMSWTAIITGYTQSGGEEREAIGLFCEMMKSSVRPNQFTFSNILKACANLSDPDLGEQVYGHVVKYGLAMTNVIGNSFVSMYARSGRMEDAQKAFNVLFEKNLVTYNAIFDGYVKNANMDEVFELLHRMEDTDVGVSTFTFASLLSSAASIGSMDKGQQLHAQVLKFRFQTDQGVGNALVSMYSKCGNIDDAWLVFNTMTDRNVISWTSMIAAFARHGQANRALDLFHEMVHSGCNPNEVTYVSVLSACSHVGLIAEGWEHFRSMHRDHGIVPKIEHYACMVDLLGRSGFLEEAVEFIKSMPLKPDALVWRTLLGAGRVHANIDLGEYAAKRILELEPHDAAAHVLLSNLYASTGRWEDVAEIRSSMKHGCVHKEAGLSWMEVDNNIHKFFVADTCHPRVQEIYSKLDELASEIKNMGYVPDLNFVLHEVEEEQKEKYLFQHSEKIAVAFGLISTSAPRPIRIFKNLRVCGDCHNAIKLISKYTGRVVVLRDSNRFHCIKEGACSCGDYW